MKSRIGILGSGIVGTTLANGLKQAGYEVKLANRTAHAVAEWDDEIGTYADVATDSDIVILAVKGTAAEEVVESIKALLSGKTVIDTTNPIADQAPDEGVLAYFTSLDESLMERLQALAPEAKFVKAFNSVGNAFMVNPTFKGQQPVMFICGNDDNAKHEVAELLKSLGWEYEDFGGVKSARAIEPLCILWCLPGMLRNEWSHAFTLLKP